MLSYAIPLYLCLISSKALSTTKTSFPGAIFTKENSRLKGYSFKWHVTPSQISCTQACLTNPRCYWTNFKENRVHGARQEGTCELNTEHPFDLISLEKDLHYEFGSLYARNSRDNLVSLILFFHFLFLSLFTFSFYLSFIFRALYLSLRWFWP